MIHGITPWHAIKVAAALCHAPQHAMFLRNTGAATGPGAVSQQKRSLLKKPKFTCFLLKR
jgi:prolyl oligopeptidase PreP (S9A serine peptidase family)